MLTVNLLIQKELKIGSSTLPLAPGHGTIKGTNATCFSCRMIRLHHRIDRMLGFFSSRPNWDPPTPSAASKCVSPFCSNRQNWDPHPPRDCVSPLSPIVRIGTPRPQASVSPLLQSSELGPPHPLTNTCEVVPPFGSGGGHTRLRE